MKPWRLDRTYTHKASCGVAIEFFPPNTVRVLLGKKLYIFKRGPGFLTEFLRRKDVKR